MSPIHSVPHLPTWHHGRMVVIGDAAHAPSPTSGQGASLSIEDAVVLAKCLRDKPNPQVAFGAFEATRRPRAERIIKWAARINNSKAAGPVARIFRDAMLPTILKMTADTKAHRQMFEYHIDWTDPAPATLGRMTAADEHRRRRAPEKRRSGTRGLGWAGFAPPAHAARLRVGGSGAVR
jgi:FAD-dependent urate hydroxylase